MTPVRMAFGPASQILLVIVSGFSLIGCSAGGSLTVDDASIKTSHEVTVPQKGGDESTRLSRMRISEETCSGFDLTPEAEVISISSLEEHLQNQGIAYSIKIERENLHLFDIKVGNSETRLRVATLKTRREAGHHLQKALLEHGGGYWGVHRSNLAVLGPPASPRKAAQFSARTGLACWGVYTQAGLDDTFAIPGGYFEL